MANTKKFNWVSPVLFLSFLFQNIYPTQAIGMLDRESIAPEDKLFLAMQGPGTDEETLFRVLETLEGSYANITRMEMRYRIQYGDLLTDLQDDLTDEEYERAMTILGSVLQDIAIKNSDGEVARKVRSIVPVSVQLVEGAMDVLSSGWAGMNSEEKALFQRVFDPGNTGEMDDVFIQAVLANYREIEQEFDGTLVMKYETSSKMCVDYRPYYTYGNVIHICPIFRIEMNTNQLGRNLVHELAHNALHVLDRSYYSPESTDYSELTPWGPWTAQIPLVGPVFREIARSDTLYHPDAYAWFAYLLMIS
jgi:hypothetical protein